MVDEDDAPNDGDLMRVITVKKCVPGHADAQGVGEKIGILTVQTLGREEALMLSMHSVRRLLLGLIDVMRFHGESFPAEVSSLLASVVAAKAAAGRPATVRGKTPSPSRLPMNPQEPLGEVEAWRAMQMVRHAKNHEDFMRLIGAPVEQVSEKRRANKKKGRRRS